jgi:hypothetical protein
MSERGSCLGNTRGETREDLRKPKPQKKKEKRSGRRKTCQTWKATVQMGLFMAQSRVEANSKMVECGENLHLVRDQV